MTGDDMRAEVAPLPDELRQQVIRRYLTPDAEAAPFNDDPYAEHVAAVALADMLLDCGCLPLNLALELKRFITDTDHALFVAFDERNRD